MKLFEHPDFEQAVIRAAEHFRQRGLREAIIEKDYFVTEALRIIEQAAGSKVIFKGGTGLSKGWNLIQRFSEDADIFLDPTAFDPPLGKKAIDRELKKLRQAIEGHPGLKFVEKESETIGGFGRNDRFEYGQHFAGTGGTRPGTIYGATDDFSYNIVKDPVHIRDFHATVLHLLGFDHQRFTYRYQGLDQRLTGVEPAHVVKELLA